MNVATPKQVAALLLRMGKKPPMQRKRHATPGYVSERRGQYVVHMFTVDRKVPTANEWMAMHPLARIRPKKKLNSALEGLLARHLPEMCTSKSARARIKAIKLVRRSPRYCDGHDALGTAFKYIVDALSGWYVAGPLYDRGSLIGQYDDKVIRTPVRPNNPVRLEYAQELGSFGFRVELWEHDPTALERFGAWLADAIVPEREPIARVRE
jgi:hypothetical protein